MNKFIQNLFLILYPFYPFWAWACAITIKKPVDFVVNLSLFPFAIYLLNKNQKLPRYLLFFIIFTIYHTCSVFFNNLFPKDVNTLYSIFFDPHVFACTLLIIIENTNFEKWFITRMNNNVVLIILISLIVSLIQIKYPSFFLNPDIDKELIYLTENRIFSIYTWTNLNSGGITIPILIAILISIYQAHKFIFPLVIISGIVLPFLTKARYVMLSAIVAFSQLFFANKGSFIKKVSFLILLVASIFLIGVVAEKFGVNISETINNRILEKESDMGSAKSRITSYEVFLTKFPEHPWVGVGPETKPDVIELLNGEATIIHIGYLSYLYFYGVVGCFFLFVSIFYLLKYAWSVGKRYDFWGSFFGLISFCLANLTFVYFNLSEMGIVIAVIYLRYYTSNHTDPIRK